MKNLPIEAITVPENRQRREFDPEAMSELGESIESKGLFHAIVVRETSDGTVLVAGERRLRAVRDLAFVGTQIWYNRSPVPLGQVPTVTLGELDPIEAEEAELEENVQRRDLTWQEKADALRRLHNLRSLQADIHHEDHTVGDTAREVFGLPASMPAGALGGYRDTVKQSIVVAEHLDDPDVAKAKSLGDAVKILKKKEQAREFARMGNALGDSVRSQHTLYRGDARDMLRNLPATAFDVILTDPPYGMGADEFGDAAGKLTGLTHEYEDSESYFLDLMGAVLPEITRVAKPAAHLYMFCDIDKFFFLRGTLNSLGWKVFRTPLILHKLNSGRVPLPEHGPRRQYETILYAYRGDRKVLAIKPDVISVDGDRNLGHGAQKPVAAFVELLSRSVRPGDTVLDPFCGTGTIFPACTATKGIATGIELDDVAFGIAANRIREIEE